MPEDAHRKMTEVGIVGSASTSVKNLFVKLLAGRLAGNTRKKSSNPELVERTENCPELFTMRVANRPRVVTNIVI